MRSFCILPLASSLASNLSPCHVTPPKNCREDDEEQGLARHEFLECILVMSSFENALEADTKFERSTLTFPDKRTLKAFLDDVFTARAKQLHNREFLEKALYTEEVENFVQNNLCIFHTLFHSNTTHQSGDESQRDRMSLAGFLGVVGNLVQSNDDERVGKIAAIAFVKAKMLVEDESASDSHTSLNLVDFIDALGRVSVYLQVGVSKDGTATGEYPRDSPIGSMAHLLQLELPSDSRLLIKAFCALSPMFVK